MKNCPSCAQEIPDDARICRWCQADLTAPSAPAQAAQAAGVAASQQETSGMAIGSLACGLLFFILPAAIAAVILGHLSRADIRRSAGRKKGAGMALAGLILGYSGVAIVPLLIIAAITIPNLLRSRIAANEASAVNSLRTINSALVLYNTTYGQYPPQLSNLAPPASGNPSSSTADLIDQVLASGAKDGYVFRYESGPGNDRYSILARPLVENQTGLRHFYVDQSGVIRFNLGADADESSTAIR